jgi:plasmid maintenance system antidote protein VapI
MANQVSASEIIKKHIILRGKDIKSLAEIMNIKQKTLYDKLQHNRLSIDDLFRLSVALDIDLEWLKFALGYKKLSQSYFDRVEIKRMSEEYREMEKERVEKYIHHCLVEFKGEMSVIISELKSTYKSVYYLLDILLPKDYQIFSVSERSVETYLVYLPNTYSSNSINPKFENGNNVLRKILLQMEGSIKHENTNL